MRCTHALAALACAAVVPGALAQAQQSIDLGASADTTIYSNLPTFANGSGSFLFAGQTGGNGDRRALIEFDFSAIPAGAQITAVELTLHLSRESFQNPGATSVSLHTATSDWAAGASDAAGGEGSGAPAANGEATWSDNFFGSSMWNTPGGDFTASASASTAVDNVGFYTWSSDGLVSDVQAWIDGSADNHGWFLIGGSNSLDARRFDSSENANAAFRPVLSVSYVPTPGALATGGLVLLGAARRRRRA